MKLITIVITCALIFFRVCPSSQIIVISVRAEVSLILFTALRLVSSCLENFQPTNIS